MKNFIVKTRINFLMGNKIRKVVYKSKFTKSKLKWMKKASLRSKWLTIKSLKWSNLDKTSQLKLPFNNNKHYQR
jgi:hypothetical protein